MPSGTPPIRHPALQARALRTEQAIVEAARALLSERDFEAVSVAAIARRAGVSVGGVYARFPDKAAIALAVDEHLLARARQALSQAMTKKGSESVETIIASYVRAMIRFFAENRPLMSTLALRSRGDERYAARDAAREFNRFAHSTLCDRLLEHRDQIHHPDPRQATELGIMMVSAAAREMVLFGEQRMNLSNRSGRELARELTRAFCGYLGAPYS